MITLILGDEKSGTSLLALNLLQQARVPHFFVGTAKAQDVFLMVAGQPWRLKGA